LPNVKISRCTPHPECQTLRIDAIPLSKMHPLNGGKSEPEPAIKWRYTKNTSNFDHRHQGFGFPLTFSPAFYRIPLNPSVSQHT
jgi:hypothetical protein